MTDPREAQALKPCPLCGREPRRNGRGGTGGVLCVGDNATVGMIHRFQTYGADQAEADAAWNRAAPPTDLEAVRESAAEVAEEIARSLNSVSRLAYRDGRIGVAMDCRNRELTADRIAAAIRAIDIEGEKR